MQYKSGIKIFLPLFCFANFREGEFKGEFKGELKELFPASTYSTDIVESHTTSILKL